MDFSSFIPRGIPSSQASALFNMDTILFFSFLFLLSCAAAAAAPCSVARCGKNKVPIRFPFRLEGKQPGNCGYTGFNLGCESQYTVYLKLPYSGEFLVRDINYLDQQIDLYDPDDCLPKRLLSLNLSGSPFVAVFRQNYTFLNCPTQVTKSRFNAIDCLSNSTNSVLATSSTRLANKMVSSSCRIITTLPIPVSWPARDDEEFTATLDSDIQLTWNAPQCSDCEEHGGIAAIGIAIFACHQDRRSRARGNRMHLWNGTAEVLPQPGPSDSTCPICLSEYLSQDTIKCIPECKHCFHVECIDEWLRMNSTCPVCRNSPLKEDASSHNDPV